MNSKQKLQKWLERFQNQAVSGRTVKDWCLQHNLSLYTDIYWKHKIEEDYIQSALPDYKNLPTIKKFDIPGYQIYSIVLKES